MFRKRCSTSDFFVLRIFIKTKISGADPLSALNQFERPLFEALSPSFPKLIINRFDGSKPGDVVDISLNFKLFKIRWISSITGRSEEIDQAWFIDEAIKPPFFLKKWKHKHLVQLIDNELFIVDDISFSSHTLLFTLLVYPMLYLQFLARRPVYKKWFNK